MDSTLATTNQQKRPCMFFPIKFLLHSPTGKPSQWQEVYLYGNCGGISGARHFQCDLSWVELNGTSMPGENQIQEGSSPLWFLIVSSKFGRWRMEQFLCKMFHMIWTHLLDLQFAASKRRRAQASSWKSSTQSGHLEGFVARVTRPSSDPHCLHCWFMVGAVSPKMASFTLNAEQTCDAKLDNSWYNIVEVDF